MSSDDEAESIREEAAAFMRTHPDVLYAQEHMVVPPPPAPPAEPLGVVVRRTQRQARKRMREAEAEDAADEEAEQPPRQRPRLFLQEGPFRPKCFLCAYGNRSDDASDMGCRPYAELIRMVRQHYGYMHNDELARQMANYYATHIYFPDDALAREQGEQETRLPWMKPDHMLEHLLYHIKNPIIRLGVLQDYLYDALLHTNAQHTARDDADDRLVKIADRLLKALTVPKSKLMFAGDEADQLDLNPAAMGGVANTRRIAPFIERRQAVVGGATASDTDAAVARGARAFNIARPQDAGDEGRVREDMLHGPL
jgi:hypothetical protein